MKKRRIKWYKIFADLAPIIWGIFLIITFTACYIYTGNIDDAITYELTFIFGTLLFVVVIGFTFWLCPPLLYVTVGTLIIIKWLIVCIIGFVVKVVRRIYNIYNNPKNKTDDNLKL